MRMILPLVMAASLALLPGTASACPMKDNAIAIVLGVVEDEIVSMRIALSEDSNSHWSGTAKLHIGQHVGVVGSIDPKANPNTELDRLIRAARAKAMKVTGFRPARQVSAKDCTSKPSTRCGDVALENDGATLRVNKLRTPLSVSLRNLEPEDLQVTGVVRYQAGKTEIAVVNVGSGDPTFATSVRTCEGKRCRPITTLHHGEQTDVVVITSGG